MKLVDRWLYGHSFNVQLEFHRGKRPVWKFLHSRTTFAWWTFDLTLWLRSYSLDIHTGWWGE